MKPHRPIDLDSLNKEFFSSEVDNSTPEEMAEIISPEKPEEIPSGLVDILKSVTISDENPVFHNIDEIESASEEAKNKNNIKFIIEDNSKEHISEEEALRSFPNFEFNPDAFDIAEDHENDNTNAEPLRIIKESVKTKNEEEEEPSEEEKAEQKKLEKIVRRPFRVKAFLSFLMVVFLLAGIFGVAFEGVLYKIGNNAKSRVTRGQYSVCYVEPKNIESSTMSDHIVLFRKEVVSGNKTILFKYDGKYFVEPIVAIGSGICAVKIPQADAPVTVDNNGIEGVVVYSLNNIKPLYYAVHNNTSLVLAADAFYFAFIICLFAFLIKKQHKKIDAFQEQYQLVE